MAGTLIASDLLVFMQYIHSEFNAYENDLAYSGHIIRRIDISENPFLFCRTFYSFNSRH